MYSSEPENKKEFTRNFDRAYSSFANMYNWAVTYLPVWRNWISTAIPHIVGPNVLEVSFGTGYLLSQYAHKFNTYGIDYNWKLVKITRKNLIKVHKQAYVQQSDIENLPYRSGVFDSVINTMAFSGYPDGVAALNEIHRVLNPEGRFILVDIDYPHDHNRQGIQATRLWAKLGDIIRDMEELFQQTGFHFIDQEIGGFGSVHLFIATKASLQSNIQVGQDD